MKKENNNLPQWFVIKYNLFANYAYVCFDFTCPFLEQIYQSSMVLISKFLYQTMLLLLFFLY